ncbi:hypothetical protein GCM10010191_07060 [Actinomadura vinacea]|uniref:Uncharacterized protein n=1 Tax=Actinomadura vinacea TaxID=115336 RepID=A0ABN3IFY9_9ACTN
MNRHVRIPPAGSGTFCLLLSLTTLLLLAQSAFGGWLLWSLFVGVALATFILGAVTAALASRERSSGPATDSDEARLDELEPFPPVPGDR